MQRERLSGLDQARSIAIIAVVAVHLSFQFPHLPQWAAVLARMGQYGVQLFLVISAITIFMTLAAASYLLSRLTDKFVQRFASNLARSLLVKIDLAFAFGRTLSARAIAHGASRSRS